jgi:hypothetical protein
MRQRFVLMAMSVVVSTVVCAAVPSAVAAPQRQAIVVTSTADSGPGTLREALEGASRGTIILFDPAVFPPDNPATIALTSPLPDLAQDEVTVDASNAGVILDGSQLPPDEGINGFTIRSSGNIISGLQILHFPGIGVAIVGGAQSNVIGGPDEGARNIISGNQGDGVRMEGSGTAYNVVIGNFIGLDVSGTQPLPNSFGVSLAGEASYNTVHGNVVSGHQPNPNIVLWDPGTSFNVIIGNLVGTDVSGTVAVSSAVGVAIRGGASDNRIGGSTPGEGNVISGNDTGVDIVDGSVRNEVIGNLIGTDISGTFAVPNGIGVVIGTGAENIVGGTAEGEGNIISGNEDSGVLIAGPESVGNTIHGNYIGTDASGTGAIGNGVDGVWIGEGAHGNLVGGGTAEERNVISGNGSTGVVLDGVMHTIISGNYIGTDASGMIALGNGFHGVAIVQGAQNNHVGGATAAERNVISGNVWDGVFIHDSGTMYNTVTGNYIGTDVSGMDPIPNGNFGINLGDSAQNNLVGGDTGAEGNVISGNRGGGVDVAGSGVSDNVISGNYIGVDVQGDQPLPNFYGVLIDDGASHNTVQGNVVSGNNQGVTIAGIGTISNTVSGNYIGTNAAGDAAIPNEIDGIWIGVGAQYNVIGGRTADERNVISGNANNGVVMDGVMYTIISGNYIGTDATGTVGLGNGNIGVVLAWGAQYNLVGGATPEERNLISGNGNVGVSIANGDTMSNTVSGNYIGTDVTGAVAIGNVGSGVHLNDGAQHNVIGGEAPGQRNVISGNGVGGVIFGASATMWNVVTGNYIGVDFGGATALGNKGDGVHIGNGAGLNIIGPGNMIAFNSDSGVSVQGPETLGNTITANSIHGNGWSGITNLDGGNAELSAPTITYVSTRIVRGTAPAGSNVEVFFDEENEGRTFQGSTIADQEGDFAFAVPAGALAGPNVTATAIDGEGNSSQFSSPVRARAQVVTRELPGILRPTQVSLEPGVVGTNVGLALFCVLFFGLTSSAFNSILIDYREDLLGAVGRLVPGQLAGAMGRIGPSLDDMAERGRGRLLLIWLIVLLLTSLIESFLDPRVAILSLERLGLLITLFVSAVAVSGLELGSDLYAHRRWAPTIRPGGKVQWVGIAIAVACVILSRALGFTPGYLYGIVGAMYVMPKLADSGSSGKRAVLVLMTVLAGGLILWIATAFLPPALAELDPVFLTAFLISLQGVFFALFPLAFTDGGHIWRWKRGVWFGFFLVVFFCFYHFVLNPDASDVQALQQNGVQTLLILIAVFGLATLTLWLLFPFRLARKRLTKS